MNARKSNRVRLAILSAASALGLLVLAIYSVKVGRKQDYTDFLVYYRAALRAKDHDWSHIYNLADGASPFRYAPMTLPWFRPFAELSRHDAQLLWFYLQFAWFALGFVFIYRALKALGTSAQAALVATFVSALMVLRFCLDCFTIGQISSLLFLGFSVAFYGWCEDRPVLEGAGMFLPALLKIGPGFLYLLLPFRRQLPEEVSGETRPKRSAALSVPAWILAGSVLLTIVWVKSYAVFSLLLQGWTWMVLGDSDYYDASHYGSQSLKSALLRLVKTDSLTRPHATLLLTVTAIVVCTAVALFWALRQPRTKRDLGLFFALGIFPYLWFMPETFKYTLTALAIPLALLVLSPARERLTWLALALAAATLSAAGLDIVGSWVFFALQYASVPLLATFALGAAVFGQAWRGSEPSDLYREIRSHFPGSKIGPWSELPRPDVSRPISVLVPIPLYPSLPEMLSDPKAALPSVLRELVARLQPEAEVLLLPYTGAHSPAALGHEDNPIWKGLERFASTLRGARVVRPPSAGAHGGPRARTRALALREGFLVCGGRFLLVVQAEQPCHAEFYLKALPFLDSGYGLVRANRRLPESRFRIPVRLLSLVYGRHRLGLLFNRLVRVFLPVETTDTQSGSWAISRELALEAFAVQGSPDFLFDLELALTAREQGFRQLDLPAQIHLTEEKAVRRIVGEALAILIGLPSLRRRYSAGCYRRAPQSKGVTADDWGISPGVNDGILELARSGIVRRVSLMANCEFLTYRIDELRAIPGIELGLHFNLTHGTPLSSLWRAARPARVFRQWLRSDREGHRARAVRAELEAQLGKLDSAGVRISYLDGHHHIHLVPGLIDSIADVLKQRGIRRVRVPLDLALVFSAKFPLVVLAWLARSRVRANGFESRPCYYPKPGHFLDQGSLRARLARAADLEIIVHPASLADVHRMREPDPYSEGRVVEFHALRMLAPALSGSPRKEALE